MKKIRLIEWLVPFPAPHCAGLVEKLVPPPRLCNSLRVEIYNKSVTRTTFNIRNNLFVRCPRHSRIPSKGISAEKKTRVSADDKNRSRFAIEIRLFRTLFTFLVKRGDEIIILSFMQTVKLCLCI